MVPTKEKVPNVPISPKEIALDVKRCYELGTNAYVVKPVDFKDFMSAITPMGFFWALLNEQPT